MENLAKKLQFYEKDNSLLKHHVKDLEMSLKINKEIIANLIGSLESQEIQNIIGKLKEENDNLY
eukprot:CAMPEP_0170553132 /NCGR_PEP_ID=MMETSP0211-20121228/10965_1 /TAXON_ID=311385 /ORGANISM="Pseudokeronopsis sp., Strain OXSARD2" /LENGTH=63 /DNA_ID=CAMNT_0010861269 /DNA_START=44 /DNA_END=235 /DNA_ORIENTATION=+